jgi:hypothetical protein
MENTTTITLNDLQMCQEIISTCSLRGAFRAEEFSVVGKLYDTLSAFITASQPPQPEKPTEDKND